MPSAKPNSPNAQRWIDEYLRHEADFDALRMEHATKVGRVREQQRAVIDAAKEDGISKKVMRALLLEIKHLTNAAKVRQRIEDEDLQAELEMIREKLKPVADLPLFGAAISAAESVQGKRAKKAAAAVDSILDDDVDVRPGVLKQKEEERNAANANAAALADIKELH